MVLFPLIVAAVTLAFAVMLYRRYRRRPRPHLLWWTVSMVQGLVASLAYVVAVTTASAFFFKLYYLFGALMVAAYLALGSVHLVARPAVARWALYGVLLFTVAGAAGILAAPVDRAALAETAATGGSGAGVLGSKGLWLAQLVVMNTFGTVGVVLPALYSAVQLARRRAAGGFVFGNLLIAAGVLLLAAAGTAARLGAGGFWGTMALGYAVAFLGFLAIEGSARSARAKEA